jgi:glycosyltransferase involved in cell wall biosynthesis
MSLARQSMPAAAITIVDDGIDNASSVRELGTQLLGDRFCLLKNNGEGISAALNTGIQQSSALWIMRMDADDISHSQRLEKQLDFLRLAPSKILGCGTQVRFINRTGRVLGHSRLPISWADTANRILSQTCFIHPTLIIRRDALLSTPYRSSMDGAEDLDLILRLVESGEILNLREALLDYRLYADQESFYARPRQTALQELAFRLANRRKKNSDPLEDNPQLAEQFIQWRLSDPAYVNARMFLTALRYMKTYLMGLNLDGVKETAVTGLRSFPTDLTSFHIFWHVFRKSAAALVGQITPFAELNP